MYSTDVKAKTDTEINAQDSFTNRLASRLDIFKRPPIFAHFLYISVFAILAVLAGLYIHTRERVEVVTDFFENVPVKGVAEIPVRSSAIDSRPQMMVSREQASVERMERSGDVRARVTEKGALGLAGGNVGGKSNESAQVFGKGGAAVGIDAILSGTAGLKSGGAASGARKGVAGIGYGAGYGAGFGGGSTKSLTKRMHERGSMTISESKILEVSGATALNREGYEHVAENMFRNASVSPLSTFSIDVDVASYANIRRFVNYKQMPPPSAVRIEEMLNYFTYSYPSPAGDHPFSISAEVSTCPWSDNNLLARIGLQGKKIDPANLPPSNLVFLIDVSGSMRGPQKLGLLKSSFRLLVDQLGEKDMVSIVVYAGAAGTVLKPTPGNQKRTIVATLERLQAGGSTAGGEGILQAYALAKKNFMKNGNNRVVLATDGDFNVGVSSDGELVRLIEKKRKDGIFLSVLGFGTGNYQDAKMEKLADKGNGNYAYIDRIEEAKKVLVRQMGGTLLTIAKDVKIQIEFNPARVKSYRLIGYENRMLAKEDFNDDKKDAGELGAGHSVTALYELVSADASGRSPDVNELIYQKQTVTTSGINSQDYFTINLRYKKPDGAKSRLIKRNVDDQYLSDRYPSDDQQFASAVAGLGMLLKESEHKGNLSYDKIIEMATHGIGDDRFGYRKEFIQLAKNIRNMQH